jgi:hypothetical protein
MRGHNRYHTLPVHSLVRSLSRYMKQRGVNTSQMWGNVRDAVVKTILAGIPTIDSKVAPWVCVLAPLTLLCVCVWPNGQVRSNPGWSLRNFFELVRFDFIFDEHAQ